MRLHVSLCAIRRLDQNSLSGPVLASITALTRLAYLCAAGHPSMRLMLRCASVVARGRFVPCGRMLHCA